MISQPAKIEVYDPFVFRVDPALYPFIAAWYLEEEDVFDRIEKALKALDGSTGGRGTKEEEAAVLPVPFEERFDAYLALWRGGKRKSLENARREGLRALRYYSRFFREVKAQIGCAGRRLDERMRGDLLELLETYHALVQPKAVVGRFECRFDEEGLRIEGMGGPIASRNLGRFFTTGLRNKEEEEYASYENDDIRFPPPEECLLFAGTIGPGIDQEVERLSRTGETYLALLLNSIGAGAADLVGVDLELQTNHLLAATVGRWRRFHVGYGDFRLEEQRRLFELLDPGRIGIALNAACLMIPEKSVSGVLAVKRR